MMRAHVFPERNADRSYGIIMMDLWTTIKWDYSELFA